jgi:hypothetical protein
MNKKSRTILLLALSLVGMAILTGKPINIYIFAPVYVA